MRGNKEQARNTRRVEILLNGLFYFSFPDGEDKSSPSKRPSGTVGLLSTREDHLPCITYERRTGPAQYITLPFPAARSMPRVIEVHKTGEDGVIVKGAPYTTGWGKPRNRNEPTSEDEHDFNWIIDFEGQDLHDGNLGEHPGTLRPKLKFFTGEFHTEHISQNKFFVLHKGIIRHFGKVARTMGVTISLVRDEKLFLDMGDGCLELPSDLTKITLDNLPGHQMDSLLKEREKENDRDIRHHRKEQDRQALRFEPTTAFSDHPANPDHSQIYYEELLDIDASERFHFIPERPASMGLLNVPFICFGGGGSSNRPE